MEPKDRIIVALDVDSPEKAISLVEQLKDHVGSPKEAAQRIAEEIEQALR